MRVFLYTLLSLCVWLSAAAAAAAESAAGDREFQLKTAYLFHFAELTRWPEPRPIVICLRGASPLRKFLPVLEGQTIDGARCTSLSKPTPASAAAAFCSWPKTAY
ncbi:YfiR/HmsC family protein [Methylomonas koyamae]|uniref:YfiR/HmsC family protein n=1 Tax=Methylomonas koyamae TaxID=702114 RepID=UPI000A7630E5|nr:YfiR/HmsC family protein [Methylomonas koyamae]